MNIKQIGRFSILALTALLTACGQNLAPTPETSAKIISKGSTPVSLAKLELGTGQTIEFLEIEPGDVVIVETGNMDRHRTKLSAQFSNGKTLPEVYRAFAPTGAVAPRALEEAQVRRVSTPDDSLQGTDTSPPDANPEIGSSKIDAASAVLDWDWNADANWFLMYFCKTNMSHFCTTNVGSAWSWRYKSVDYTYFEVTGMNASFDSGAFLWSDYYKCVTFSCSWRRSWDGHIPPREYRTLVYTKTRPRSAQIDGYGVNPRVHLAVMRVIKDKPTPPSLSVSAQGNHKFRVTGSSYKSNSVVYVHIGYGNFTNEAIHTIMSNSSGAIDTTLSQSCINGLQMNFVANDGRLNPDTGSDLFSNNAYATCQ